MKRIFLTLLAIPLLQAAEKNKLEYIRVDEDAKAARLQTSVVKMEKNGRQLDLIGAVHIADQAYYDALNERFAGYDRVLFEMVGGENINDTEAEEKENKLSGLRAMYDMMAKFLQLTGQVENIDYTAKNFVHADMTMEEFEAKQKERKESLLGLALKASLNAEMQQNAKQPNTAKLLAAMLSGNGASMKLELVDTLGQGDDQIGMFAGETVIVDDRNAKCLEVLDQQLAEGHKKLAIFYGAAHFPSMEKSLTEKGWQRKNEEWLTAWDIPKPKKKKAPVMPKKKAA